MSASGLTRSTGSHTHSNKQTMLPSHRSTPMKSLVLALGMVVALSTGATAQTIAQDVCACSPSQYEFTFDFSLTCPPVNITKGNAISATSCLTSPFGSPDVADLVPVSVQSIDVLELGQDLRVLVQENIVGDFADGDSFQYSSISNLPAEITAAVDIPRAIQLNVIGVNALDEPIITVYIITFTNDCGSYPVLVEGESAGWTVFSKLENARQEFCPLSPGLDPVTLAPVPALVDTSSAPTATPVLSIVPAVPDSASMAPTPYEEPPTVAPVSMAPSMYDTPAPFAMSMSMDYDMEALMESLDGEFGLAPAKSATVKTRGKKNKGEPAMKEPSLKKAKKPKNKSEKEHLKLAKAAVKSKGTDTKKNKKKGSTVVDDDDVGGKKDKQRGSIVVDEEMDDVTVLDTRTREKGKRRRI